MATRKPIVFDDAHKLQELQAGDNLDAGADQIEATFTSLTIAGSPVYANGNDTVDLARANVDGTSKVVGLAKTAVASSALGFYIFDGPVTLLTTEWDALTGEAGGLTVDLCYFLSDAATGLLLEQGNTSSITGGDNVVLIGTAISTTTLMVRIHQPIKTAA